jgi:phospholipid/cholesterol/gamma-HCH transport system permease protein
MAAEALPTVSSDKPSRAIAFAGSVGASFLEIAETTGGMGVLFGRILSRLFPPRFDVTELKRNLYKMAVKSLPIVVVTALFTGAIMVIQAAPRVCSGGARASARYGR